MMDIQYPDGNDNDSDHVENITHVHVHNVDADENSLSNKEDARTNTHEDVTQINQDYQYEEHRSEFTSDQLQQQVHNNSNSNNQNIDQDSSSVMEPELDPEHLQDNEAAD